MSKQKLHAINLNVRRTDKNYFIAFVYLPNKMEVCKAKSAKKILEHYKSYPTSHAAFCWVFNNITKFKYFLVVGKYSFINKDKNKHFYKIIKSTPIVFGNEPKRSKYYLMKETWKDNVGFNKEVELIFSWRNLPKKHLLQFDYIDNPSLIKKVKAGSRWSNLEFK